MCDFVIRPVVFAGFGKGALGSTETYTSVCSQCLAAVARFRQASTVRGFALSMGTGVFVARDPATRWSGKDGQEQQKWQMLCPDVHALRIFVVTLRDYHSIIKNLTQALRAQCRSCHVDTICSEAVATPTRQRVRGVRHATPLDDSSILAPWCTREGVGLGL